MHHGAFKIKYYLYSNKKNLNTSSKFFLWYIWHRILNHQRSRPFPKVLPMRYIVRIQKFYKLFKRTREWRKLSRSYIYLKRDLYIFIKKDGIEKCIAFSDDESETTKADHRYIDKIKQFWYTAEKRYARGRRQKNVLGHIKICVNRWDIGSWPTTVSVK